MKNVSRGRAGRQPMVEKQQLYVRLIRQGMSNSQACRELGIDRKTGHWWKNGGVITRNGVSRVVEPITGQRPRPVESGRYLSEHERVVIADGVRDGRSAHSLAAELGRAVSTVCRELKRNQVDGEYRPHQAHQMMLRRRPRPKPRRIETDEALRALVQGYLDKYWSPEQIAHELGAEHHHKIAVETIYQALYSPNRCVERDPRSVLRTGRSHRRPRRRGDQRRPRFVVPIAMIDERPAEVLDRNVPGHWEGDLIVGAFNRSAIGTLVERTTRYTILVHLDSGSRAANLRDQLIATFNTLPQRARKSLTWDQGNEMCFHHLVAQATAMPVFFCHRGSPWQRPTNEHTNGLLRNYFPKGTDLGIHSPDRLTQVSNELNRRPRKTLDWQTPHDLFTTIQTKPV